MFVLQHTLAATGNDLPQPQPFHRLPWSGVDLLQFLLVHVRIFEHVAAERVVLVAMHGVFVLFHVGRRDQRGGNETLLRVEEVERSYCLVLQQTIYDSYSLVLHQTRHTTTDILGKMMERMKESKERKGRNKEKEGMGRN